MPFKDTTDVELTSLGKPGAMQLQKLWGHQENFQRMRQSMLGASPFFTWLLSGPQGVGKRTFIVGVLKMLIAENKIRSGVLPAIETPLETENFFSHERLGAWSHDIFFMQAPLIASVRSMKRFLSTKALHAGFWRCVILLDLHETRECAQSALLKILEEPPEKTLFLATTKSIGPILPTLRSRFWHQNLKPLTEKHFAEMWQHLKGGGQHACSTDMLYVQSYGCVGRALRLAPSSTVPLKKLYDIFLHAFLPPSDNCVYAPFHPQIFEALNTLKVDALWEHLSLWLKFLLLRFVQGKVSKEERSIIERMSLLCWDAFLTRGALLMDRAHVFHLSPSVAWVMLLRLLNR